MSYKFCFFEGGGPCIDLMIQYARTFVREEATLA